MLELSKALNRDKLFIPDDIKVRVYEAKDALMGEIQQPHEYIAAELVVLDNKTEEQKQQLLQAVQDTLVGYFPASACKRSITTRLTLLNPTYYQRWVNY